MSEAFPRENPANYILSAYPGATGADARRQIKILLNEKNFMVNVSPFKKSDIQSAIGGSSLPSSMVAAAVENGMIWTKCYYDGTNKTGEIKAGAFVVFDTVTGKAVTGINEAWNGDEYKIVGVAWKSYSTTSGFGRIPITLQRSNEQIQFEFLGKLNGPLNQGSNVGVSVWKFDSGGTLVDTGVDFTAYDYLMKVGATPASINKHCIIRFFKDSNRWIVVELECE